MTAAKENGRTANGASSNAALSKKDAEKAVRAIFRDHFRKLTKALLKPVCHRMLEAEIVKLIATVQFFKHEAKRKKPSRAYLDFCRRRAAEAIHGYIGNLNTVNAEQLAILRKMLDGIIRGMLGKPVRRLDPAGFVELQRKMFIEPRKRGPKQRAMFDEAYRRFRRKESVTAIAREMAPKAFADDPLNTVQKFSKAIHRRKRAARKRAMH